MAENTTADPIAMSEDDVLAWFPRDVGRRKAKRSMDALGYEWPAWRLRTKRQFMRPFDPAEDCPADHQPDEEWAPDDCRCIGEEEGWHFTCSASHPRAIPVWRVEARWEYPFSRVRHWVRKHVYRAYIGQGRHVLWGGRVERDTNRFDRLFLGWAFTKLYGDYWLAPGRGYMAYCPRCQRVTLHDNTPIRPGGAGWCNVRGHYDEEPGDG